MDRHQLATLAVIGGAGGALAWWLTQKAGGGVYAPLDLNYMGDSGGLDAPGAVSDVESYLSRLSAAEDPTGDPYAKNPLPGQTASGLYQFTKATWTSLGGDWGNDPSKAFGGLTPSPEEQHARAVALTAGNAALLAGAGVDPTPANLYAIHMLGPGRGPAVLPGLLSADPSAPLGNFLPAHIIALNKALGSTVGSFLSYFARKVGG